MKLLLPQVYPVTDALLSGVSLDEQVQALIDAGCRFLQIREKQAESRDLFEAVCRILKVSHEVGAKVIVNDRVDIALAAGADGVHLGQTDLPPAEARKLLGDNAIIGFSTHSVEQAVKAARQSVDYIAIGPVFETSTKADTEPVVGVDGVRAVRDAVGDIPLVAIGGITRLNIANVIASRADSAAIIGDIMAGPPEEIGQRFRAVLSAASA